MHLFAKEGLCQKEHRYKERTKMKGQTKCNTMCLQEDQCTFASYNGDSCRLYNRKMCKPRTGSPKERDYTTFVKIG